MPPAKFFPSPTLWHLLLSSFINFIALPNNPAAKATDESEERRLMQYMLSLSARIFGIQIPQINATSKVYKCRVSNLDVKSLSCEVKVQS